MIVCRSINNSKYLSYKPTTYIDDWSQIFSNYFRQHYRAYYNY